MRILELIGLAMFVSGLLAFALLCATQPPRNKQ